MFQSASNHQKYFAAFLNSKSKVFNFTYFFQESNQGSKAAPMSPNADGEDAESPMPLPHIQSAVRRRGAVSAEPITEEDVATYVKKVRSTSTMQIFSPYCEFPFFARKMPTIQNIWFCHHVDCLVLLLRSFFKKN